LPTSFGAEEGFENFFDEFRGNSIARIPYDHFHVAPAVMAEERGSNRKGDQLGADFPVSEGFHLSGP
jgi:hypothetical protein